MRLFLAIVLLASCAPRFASHKDVFGPDGAQAHEASCKGRKLTPGDCMTEASNVCAGKYTVVDKNAEGRSLIFKCDKEPERPSQLP